MTEQQKIKVAVDDKLTEGTIEARYGDDIVGRIVNVGVNPAPMAKHNRVSNLHIYFDGATGKWYLADADRTLATYDTRNEANIELYLLEKRIGALNRTPDK